MWKVFKVNKKDTSKTKVNCCRTLVRFEQTLHLVCVLLWPFFEKQVNVQCGIGSISMLIFSHIHNAANRAIAKNSWQTYFKKFEVFSRKQQRAISWLKNLFLHLTKKYYFAQVANSLSIFQQQYLLWHNAENKWKVIIHLRMLFETQIS